ncbi:excisionase family DNA binding protein [Arthrobacter silviterrae]|uniref:Helix-turn-helix domain-containing protein n=1 Tax=Arthrobacter silviterrae TaxID=2026658 RepID=A0ABX0DM81_9MICC|nr:helix-turn-helix domain-containing protein [Arthrobacter silviterrae]MDQ0277526.1 excisionase family DNA binding protein [Arthrobacter silviterrae]NGN85353.1 helix-turn-helix domain-containing protein [Arthrobacter silviterrae]
MLANTVPDHSQDPTAEEWLSPREICNILHIPEQTFYQWRVNHQGPRAHKVGRHVRVIRSDFETWIAEHLEA